MSANQTEHPPASPDGVLRLTYTKRELCAALHLSPVTLWRLEQRGVLMPLRGLRHKIYPVSVVERFLAKGAA
uniref:hypothetical protein n=1 Tax=Cephaloticoccus sp. TaxID=1985742 RepID=UPI00404A0AC1